MGILNYLKQLVQDFAAGVVNAAQSSYPIDEDFEESDREISNNANAGPYWPGMGLMDRDRFMNELSDDMDEE